MPVTHKTTILTLKQVSHRHTFMEYITDLPNDHRAVTHLVIHCDKTWSRKDLRKGVFWFVVQELQFIAVEEKW